VAMSGERADEMEQRRIWERRCPHLLAERDALVERVDAAKRERDFNENDVVRLEDVCARLRAAQIQAVALANDVAVDLLAAGERIAVLEAALQKAEELLHRGDTAEAWAVIGEIVGPYSERAALRDSPKEEKA
jgi:chorismate mutase